MSIDAYLPIWTFIMLMVGTPGPANLLIMSLGAQHGFWKSVPFNAGLITGKLLLNLVMAFGLASVMMQYSVVTSFFSYISAAYISWLALKGWNIGGYHDEHRKTLHFLHGSCVHPLNPKAWLMSFLAFSEFSVPFQSDAERYLLIPMSFLFAQLIFHSSWCLAGHMIRQTIGISLWLNRSLILLTIAVVVWAVW